MLKVLKRFAQNQDGAVTVDWVVLSAAVIGMGMAALGPIAYETENATQDVGDGISELGVGYVKQN